ncbi:MAG: hypothetical protein JWR08_1278, partial [Enterovirga sp.]|nr:hypothetical protein [Enterovirga sp.]
MIPEMKVNDIIASRRSAVFGPAELDLMTRAFDLALASLTEGRFDHIPARLVRRVLASKVIEAGRAGEGDPDRIAAMALAELALSDAGGQEGAASDPTRATAAGPATGRGD